RNHGSASGHAPSARVTRPSATVTRRSSQTQPQTVQATFSTTTDTGPSLCSGGRETALPPCHRRAARGSEERRAGVVAIPPVRGDDGKVPTALPARYVPVEKLRRPRSLLRLALRG